MKRKGLERILMALQVAPRAGGGLKLLGVLHVDRDAVSPPVRGRGLKRFGSILQDEGIERRPPCGGAD